MKAYVFANHTLHQQRARDVMIAGLRRHGVAIVTRPAEADFVACWGWHYGSQFRAGGHDVLVMERGYIADRMAWTSLAWDGLNGRGRFPLLPDGAKRFEGRFRAALSERRTGGAYTLLLGQVRGDASLQGRDLQAWYAVTAADLGALYGLPVYFRPHPMEVQNRGPKAAQDCPGVPVLAGGLEEALSAAAAVAAFNSNSLTDAALAGVPVLAGDPGAMTWPIAGQGLGSTPRLVNRMLWAARMGWCQWSAQEIRNGDAWAALQTVLEPLTGWTPALQRADGVFPAVALQQELSA